MNASFRFTGLLENTTAGETHKYTDKSGLLPWSVTLFQRRVAKFLNKEKKRWPGGRLFHRATGVH